ncbi:MAG: KH domain-containing protein [bacterium]
MQDILEYILKNITTVPDDVKIAVEDLEGTTNYIVTVNPADVGRIIGKEGKVIKAIRTIMRVIAIQRGVHVRVSIVSENNPVEGVVEQVAEGTTTEPTLATDEPAPAKEEGLTVEV